MSGPVHGRKPIGEGVLNPPNHQPALFYETAADALGSCIQAAGGFKRVAGQLWPSMKAESAYARLKACLDDAKHERLSPDEIIGIAKMAREQGCHAWAQFVATELGYAAPVALDPEDERAALQREFVDGVARLEALARRLSK